MKSYTKLLLLGFMILALSACYERQAVETKDTQAKPEATQAKTASWSWPDAYPEGPQGDLVRYGESLIAETPRFLGPDAKDPNLRLAGNRLSCSNCHLQKGTEKHAMGFVGIYHRYPRYYPPQDREVTLGERINACFERSLNGRPLPLDSKELHAMTAYMSWLSAEVPKDQKPVEAGLPGIKLLKRPADRIVGKEIYTHSCSACHGAQGEGLPKDGQNFALGYVFPPLAGKDSFTTGSNLARLIVAARYIRANMPLGRAILSAEEAFDVAAYVNNLPRPVYSGAGQDYPNLKTKPVDVPYGPWSDSKSVEEHTLGPFLNMTKEAVTE